MSCDSDIDEGFSTRGPLQPLLRVLLVPHPFYYVFDVSLWWTALTWYKKIRFINVVTIGH
jgi:hypothetical protein